MGLRLAVKIEAPAGLNGFDILLLPAAKKKEKDPMGSIRDCLVSKHPVSLMLLEKLRASQTNPHQ